MRPEGLVGGWFVHSSTPESAPPPVSHPSLRLGPQQGLLDPGLRSGAGPRREPLTSLGLSWVS